jgi:hypothetical protein
VPTLIWRDEARADVRAIFDFIAERDLAAATRLREAIGACAERLPDHPFMYRRGRGRTWGASIVLAGISVGMEQLCFRAFELCPFPIPNSYRRWSCESTAIMFCICSCGK